MSTEFYLIRHGESVANLLHSLAGSTDVPLTELGINQAEATARALRDIHFDAVYSSPLVRAVDTAKPHAEMRGLRVQVHEGVREIFLGEWEGRRVDEIIKSYGISSYEGGWQGSFGTYRVPGAESAAECAERVFAAMKEIALRNPDSRVLVVSHGAALRSFWSKISGVALADIAATVPYPSNASYSRALFDGEKFLPLEFSSDAHLSSVGITKVNW